jgi:carbonic anhydrase
VRDRVAVDDDDMATSWTVCVRGDNKTPIEVVDLSETAELADIGLAYVWLA